MRKGETKNILPLSAVTLRPFSQKTCIVFERLADIFLRFVQRNTFAQRFVVSGVSFIEVFPVAETSVVRAVSFPEES